MCDTEVDEAVAAGGDGLDDGESKTDEFVAAGLAVTGGVRRKVARAPSAAQNGRACTSAMRHECPLKSATTLAMHAAL